MLIGLVVPWVLVSGAVAEPVDVKGMLEDFATGYSRVHAETSEVCIEVSVSPPGETWYILLPVSGGAEVRGDAPTASAFVVSLSATTLSRIYSGEITAFTAAAKGSGEEIAPLEFQFREAAVALRDAKGVALGFLQHFFTRGRPERIALGQEHSRVVHGAHAIPLYYAAGFRSAWYRVNDGEQLNELGDTNPFPQAFVIISGRGTAQIGEFEAEVQAGESYYIPPGADHVLRPAPGGWLELIWLAWGDGA